MWQDLWPWVLGATVALLAGIALWSIVRRPRPTSVVGDRHGLALQHWLTGDLVGARDLLREVVSREPQHVEPYLHLGILLRLTGEPGRAAALHRSLAVRPGLSLEKRASVGLELAADLIDLKRWGEANDVLGQLRNLSETDPRWHRLRFAAAIGDGREKDAGVVLDHAVKELAADDAPAMNRLRAAWFADRALSDVRRGDYDAARLLLRRLRGMDEVNGREHLVEAMLAAANQDAEKAVRAVEKGLASYPAQMAPVLPVLEGVLADTGTFARIVPILETACAKDDSPPEIWMALSRLYEKLDRREDAIRLLAGKRGDPRLTPDAAAPYLRLLTADVADAAVTKVWNLLADPGRDRIFVCRDCGRQEIQTRWFCPDCLAPDSFESTRSAALTESSVPAAVVDEPPRY